MNIKKIILAFAASAMLAGGCTSLDMDPVSDITDLNYWKTPEQFDSFVFGLHSRFRSHSWNMFCWVRQEVMSLGEFLSVEKLPRGWNVFLIIH